MRTLEHRGVYQNVLIGCIRRDRSLGRRNSRTVLTFEKLEYNVPMKDENFTLQALRRNQ